MFGKIPFICSVLGSAVSLTFSRLTKPLKAFYHRLIYKAVADPRNVVVIGASFAGYFLAEQLANSLPTGWRVIVIERNSHFHFTWLFPRMSAIPGHEHKAFVPYPLQPASAPAGSYLFRRGTVVNIKDNVVTLDNGEQIEFAYLAIATGSRPRFPVEMTSSEKQGGIDFFRARQERVKDSKSVMVVGGGPVGVEIAGDIKSQYPNKTVTLLHSRDRLANSFGIRLHDAAIKALHELGVIVILNERPVIPDDAAEVVLKNGETVKCDFIIKCTGQKPASDLVSTLSAALISPSGTILVNEHLQVADPKYANVYALGDVAETKSLKMGRAASMQAFFVADNICRSIRGQPLKQFRPTIFDRAIELTLGLKHNVTYVGDGKTDILFHKASRDDALHAAVVWKMLGAKPFQDPAESKAE